MYIAKELVSLQLAILETLEKTSPGTALLVINRMREIGKELEAESEIGYEMRKVIRRISGSSYVG